MGFLKNCLNSCYLDSALFAILFRSNKYIDDHILNSTKHSKYRESEPLVYEIIESMRNELIDIQNSIRHGSMKLLTKFRRQLSDYVIAKMTYAIIKAKIPRDQLPVYRRGITPTIEILADRGIIKFEEDRAAFISQLWMKTNDRVTHKDDVLDWIKQIRSVLDEHKLQILYETQQLSPIDIYTKLVEIFQLEPSVEMFIQPTYRYYGENKEFPGEPGIRESNFILMGNGIGLRGIVRLSDMFLLKKFSAKRDLIV